MKKSIFTAALFSLAMISSTANAQDNLEMDILVNDHQGAWVTVSLDDQPVVGAAVTANRSYGSFYTNENGRVFIPVRDSGPHSVVFTAEDSDGHFTKTTRFIPSHR